jgi:PAS domain S-box-containing protein
MLGYKAEELLGRSSHRLWHHTQPDGSPNPRETCAIHAVYREGKVHRSSDDVFWRKDGTSFLVEYASTPLYERGRLAGAVLFFSDITERKKQEEIAEHELDIRKAIGELLKLSLEESSLENYLKKALDLILGIPWFAFESRGALFLVEEDPATLVMTVQRGLSDFIQKSCGLLPFGKCHCGKAAAAKKIEFSSAVTERHEIHYEGMIPHGHYCVPILFGEKVVGVLNVYLRENYKKNERTEHFLWMLANALAGAIEQKKGVEALHKAHEELERRVADRTEKLAESQAYVQKILATITDYIYTVTVRNGAAVATTHQPTCLAVTGYTAEEFKDQPDLWQNIVVEEDRPLVRLFSAAVLTGKNVQEVEHRIRCKDGSIRWVRNVPVLHYDASGRVTSYDGIISDITEKVRAEMLLIDSMKKVAMANKAKDQFLANMSHEVRTPLNAIIGFSCLLENTGLDPVQKGYVEMLRNGGETLLSLITDVLDFSRIASGEVRLEKTHFDLERLIQGVIKVPLEKLKKKDLRIFCAFDEKVPHGFFGDPARIRRILMQLLSNAVKFTEKGEVEIRVTLDREMESKDSKARVVVRIAVRDTGIGIPPEKLGTIFDTFVQADISTTRKYGGSGLGLSISKTLIELMGGTIEVRSEPGKGSTFSLLLPLEVEPALKEVQIFPLQDKELEGKTIFILDDDEITVKVFSRYCEEAKMVVSGSASSAQDALKWLPEQASLPDIFLTDILLSDLSGYEVAEKVRGNKKYNDIKLIAVTGDVREEAAFKARQSGFDAFLQKPASRENLIKVIKTVLGDKREKILPVEIVTQYTADELIKKGLKILVVEDNPASQELLSILLRGFEFGVEIASDGREATEKVKRDPYDLILMDLQMPVMGGLEATRIIREQLHKTMPILALTAGISEDDREKCLAAGMNDYLEKPIEVATLKDKIFHWIRGTSQERPASRKKESVVKWDKQKAIKELGIPEGLYRELVLGFIEQSAVAIQDLEKAFQSRNFEEVAKAAHFIKGAAGNLRIEEIHVTAKELEAVAKGGQDAGMIEQQMRSLKNAIEEMKKYR